MTEHKQELRPSFSWADSLLRINELTKLLLVEAESKISLRDQQIEKLREAFERYGHHDLSCDIQEGLVVPRPCSCGFEEAQRILKEMEK